MMGMENVDPKWRYAWEIAKQVGRAGVAVLTAGVAVVFMRLAESFGATPEQACFAVAIGFMSIYGRMISRVIISVAKTFAEDIDAQRMKASEDAIPNLRFDAHRDI